jgi:nicotinate-nucleotide pyrophosphorylase (carboxylating)
MKLSDELKASIGPAVASALAEDIGSGDLTAALIDAEEMVGATILARESLVLCQTAEADDVICKLVGPARGLLTGERTALNFLQTLSSTATEASKYVAAIAGTECRILDTRKTIPGLRLAQKYAAKCGGAVNHRVGLFDAILIKENHIKSAGSITKALQTAQGLNTDVLIEVEVESHDELLEALDAGAGRILLDNFSVEELQRAVKTNQDYGYTAAELEASGNITLDTIREIAETGVNYISTGAITKNIKAIDFSMLFKID